MNPLIYQIDDHFLKEIYYGVLGKKGDIQIVRNYSHYIIQHIGVRQPDEKYGVHPLIQIENDLTVTFDPTFLDSDGQKKVIDFLRGNGFPVK
jgi:signal peptidase I